MKNKSVPIFKVTDFIASICQKNETMRIALSGGSTPKPVYKALASRKDIPFENIEFFQVDERYVLHDHSDSNYKMINEILIDPIKTRIKAFHAFDTSLPMEKALEKYEKIVKNALPFDLTILGIGNDGHTASLFPHSPALHENARLTAHTTTDQFMVRDRLTLTFHSILNSKNLLVLLKGKQHIMDELSARGKISEKDISEFPAKKLLGHKNLTIFSVR